MFPAISIGFVADQYSNETFKSRSLRQACPVRNEDSSYEMVWASLVVCLVDTACSVERAQYWQKKTMS